MAKLIRHKGWFFIIPVAIIGLCAGLYFTPVYEKVDARLFDLLSFMKPAKESAVPVLLLDIGDEDLDRGDLGRGLTAAGELGAEYAVLPLDLKDTGGPDLYSDADVILGGGLRFFENSFVPLYMRNTPNQYISQDLREYIEKTFLIQNLTVLEEQAAGFPDYTIPALPILEAAKSGGFLEADSAGKPATAGKPEKGQISLIRRGRNSYYPHIVFSALLQWFDSPTVYLHKDRIVLENAAVPGREMKNIVIPLAESGLMYVRRNTFKTVPFSELLAYEDSLLGLIHTVEKLNGTGIFNLPSGGANGKNLLQIYSESESLRLNIETGRASGNKEDYGALRERFIRDAGAFFLGDAETEIIGALRAAEDDEESGSAGDESASDIPVSPLVPVGPLPSEDEILSLFDEGRQKHKQTLELREELVKLLDNKFCILYAGEAETESAYLYAGVLTTIIEEDFIDDFPWWYSLAAAAVLAFLLIFVLTRLKPFLAVLIGLPGAVVFAGLPLIPFYFFSYYLPLFFPAAAVCTAYIGGILVQIIAHSKYRRELVLLFSKSVPKEDIPAVAEMLKTPPGAEAGEKLQMSVMASQITSIGGIITGFDPSVALSISTHHSRLIRETVLYRKGLVGNTDTDSAWAAWGVFPKEASTAAWACGTALMVIDRVQASGKGYGVYVSVCTGQGIRGNKLIKGETNVPMTGIPIVQSKRIVNANDLYGTRIVITENVKNELKDEYILRRLDKVRIEGSDNVIRLYELAGEKKDLTPDIKEFLEIFEQAQGLFDRQDWVRAHKKFIQAIKLRGDDKASKLYARRCQKFVQEPPSASWDGCFTIPGV